MVEKGGALKMHQVGSIFGEEFRNSFCGDPPPKFSDNLETIPVFFRSLDSVLVCKNSQRDSLVSREPCHEVRSMVADPTSTRRECAYHQNIHSISAWGVDTYITIVVDSHHFGRIENASVWGLVAAVG